MRIVRSTILGLSLLTAGLHGQAPVAVDAIGPQPGTRVPEFSATDQAGRVHTVKSLLGPKEIYSFAPLDERVEVYQKAFTLVQDLTVLATADVQKPLAGQKTVTVPGQLEYQACDDKVCCAPTAVPLNFTLELTPLLRP